MLARRLSNSEYNYSIRDLTGVDVPVYLEASAARNVPLYERHGFRLTGEPVTLPDGPTVWPMWRDQEN